MPLRYGKQHDNLILPLELLQLKPLHLLYYMEIMIYLYNLSCVKDPVFSREMNEASKTFDKAKPKRDGALAGYV